MSYEYKNFSHNNFVGFEACYWLKIHQKRASHAATVGAVSNDPSFVRAEVAGIDFVLCDDTHSTDEELEAYTSANDILRNRTPAKSAEDRFAILMKRAKHFRQDDLHKKGVESMAGSRMRKSDVCEKHNFIVSFPHHNAASLTDTMQFFVALR